MNKNTIIIIGGIAVSVICLAFAAIPFVKGYQDKQAMKKSWEERMARKSSNPDPNAEWVEQSKSGQASSVSVPADAPAQSGLKEQPAALPANLTEPPPEEKKEPVAPWADLNPFLNKGEKKIFKEFGNALPLTGVEVSAILYSKTGRQAVINGRILREGDLFDGKEIVEIRPEEVLLKDMQGQYLARMRGVIQKPVDQTAQEEVK